MKSRLKFISFYLFLTAATLSATEEIRDESQIEIVSPDFQDRKTKKIQLDNGLKVYLVSDPQSKKSSVALSVNTGSWDEPPAHMGLAHFLEHMLFMGTKSHPDEATFTKFIKQYDGETNAFTMSRYTTFIFSMNTKGFAEGLSLFSEFFAEPLLKKEGAEREVQAVNQEFTGSLQDQDWRDMMIYKTLANPEHPWSRFDFGNKETLANSTVEDLRQFFDTHYSANLMQLVVYSPLPLSELEKMVEASFSKVPNHNFTVDPYSVPLFAKESLGKILFIEPIEQKYSLSLLWELPEKIAESVKEQPENYFCSLIGHEGEDSLLAYLKKKGVALELSCGSTRFDNEHMLLLINITLTEKGVKEYKQVIEAFFQTLALLKSSTLPEYHFHELNQIAHIKSIYPYRKSPFEEAESMVKELFFEDLSTYPRYTQSGGTFRRELINELASSLIPEKMVVDLTAPPAITGVTPDKREPWMGARYAVQSFTPAEIKEWSEAKPNPAIHFPAQNPFIPENVSLLVTTKGITESPKLLVEEEKGKLFFAQDKTYLVPNVYFSIQVHTPAIRVSEPERVVLGELYLRALKKLINPHAYLAQLAGMEYALELIDNGFKITLTGLSPKAPEFLQLILTHLKEVKPTESSFRAYLEVLKQEYANAAVKPAYAQAIDLFKEALYKSYSSNAEKLEAANHLTFEQFNQFSEELFSKIYVETLLYGNLDEKTAKEIWQTTMANIPGAPLPLNEQQKREVAIFAKQPSLLEIKTNAQGNAVLLTIEEADFSFFRMEALNLLSSAMSTPFFQTLRTEQQTAYIIANIQEELDKKLFSLFILESHSHDPRDLLARVEAFIEAYMRDLLHESEPQFITLKQAEKENLSTPPANMKEQGKEWATNIYLNDADFSWNQKRLDALLSLTFEQYKEIAEEALGKKNQRRLALLLMGKEAEEDILHYTPVPSINALKEKMSY